jgi:hypothetical protein
VVSRADAYAAFAWLESRIGPDGVRAFARAISRGRSLQDALWDVVGVSLPELRAASLVWGRTRIAARLPLEREVRFVNSLQLQRGGRVAAAAARWRDLIRQDSEGPLRDTLRYLLARQALEAEGIGRAERAEPHVRELIGSSSTLWRAESLVLLGELRVAQGRNSEAAAAFRAVLDGHWDEPGPARRARGGLQKLAAEPSTGG